MREAPRQTLVRDPLGQPVPAERLVLGAGFSQRVPGVQAIGPPPPLVLPAPAGRKSPSRGRRPSAGQGGGESGGAESVDGEGLSLYRKVAAETPRNPNENRKKYRARVLAIVRSEIKDKKDNPRARLVPYAGRGRAGGPQGGRGKGKGRGKQYLGAHAKSKSKGRG